jgi:hypothetical protein
LLRRVEAEEYAPRERVSGAHVEPVVAAVTEADGELPALPRDHPRWVKDAVAVSQRAREIVAKLRPIVIRVLGFWDHRIRSTFVTGRCVRVEPSGCYRIE